MPRFSARFTRFSSRLALIAAALSLGGCVTKQLGPDFSTFSEAYARDLNWQMLLNLARLDQGHPAYFMAIGEIRLARNQSVSLGGGANASRTSSGSITRTVTNVLGGSLSPSTSTSASPTFIFIPINSEEAAKQLLSPISIDVFNTLYQQGWPVDQLLRVMVERIEVDVVDPVKGPTRLVLTNSPTRASSPESFTRFLRACEVVRAMQKRGGLQLVAEELAGGPVPSAAGTTDAKRPSAGGKALAYRFRSNPKILDEVLAEFAADPRYADGNALANLGVLFRSALTVGSGASVSSAHEEDAAARQSARSTLVLRSFRNVLDAVAQEQRAFDELARRDSAFLAAIPERQRHPVLRTDWSGQPSPLLKPVAQLSYAGRSYQITDPEGDVASLDSRWNRDAFRLLLDLSSQVTVDITKFQRQVLELTQ